MPKFILYVWVFPTQVLIKELQFLPNTLLDIIYVMLLKEVIFCNLPFYIYFYSFSSFDQIHIPSLMDDKLNLPKSKDF